VGGVTPQAGMGSIERVETVLRGGIPDRVPVDLHDFMVAARASGASFADHVHSAEAMAEGHIASWRRFGHDVVLVESGTASLAEACGVGVEYLALRVAARDARREHRGPRGLRPALGPLRDGREPAARLSQDWSSRPEVASSSRSAM
jgi:hypothetical protein